MKTFELKITREVLFEKTDIKFQIREFLLFNACGCEINNIFPTPCFEMLKYIHVSEILDPSNSVMILFKMDYSHNQFDLIVLKFVVNFGLIWLPILKMCKKYDCNYFDAHDDNEVRKHIKFSFKNYFDLTNYSIEHGPSYYGM